MPRPASATSIATAPVRARAPTRTALPVGEYLIAFEIRLVRTRSSASGSAATTGSAGSYSLLLRRVEVRRRPLAEQTRGGLDGRLDLHRYAAERGLEPALDPRQVEQVADDPAEPSRLAPHDPREPRDLFRRQPPERQDFAEALQRRQRGPQLVRRDCDERRLRAIALPH